jgi:aryl-alcohol dehydrogenase-like predicted oxidoreductase
VLGFVDMSIRKIDLCIGTWFGGSPVARRRFDRVLDAAADCGIRKIDTSPRYLDGNAELWTGNWLRGRTDQAFSVATRVHLAASANDHSEADYVAQLQASNTRLGLSYVDSALLEEVPHSLTASALGAIIESLLESKTTRSVSVHFPLPETLFYLKLRFGDAATSYLRVHVPCSTRDTALGDYLRVCDDLRLPVSVYGAIRSADLSTAPDDRLRRALEWLSFHASVDTLIVGATRPQHLSANSIGGLILNRLAVAPQRMNKLRASPRA